MSSAISRGRSAAAACAVVAGLIGSNTTSLAADPPACADADVLKKIQLQYELSAHVRDPTRKLVGIKDVREVGLGAPPPSANQYATSTTLIALSRYCEGQAQIEAGELDPMYWRIDQAKEGAGEYTRMNFCSKRYDAFADNCESSRPGGS